MKQDDFYLKKAVDSARQAYDQDEVPVGAVIVDGNGEIVASAWNQVEQKHNQAEHAELKVLQEAAQKKAAWRLDDCTLYVSLEPCLMCLGAIYLFRIKRLVYGAESPLFGAVLEKLDKDDLLRVYKNFTLDIDYIPSEESKLLLKEFFKEKRSRKNEQNRIKESESGTS
jgi:tRNA(adenine34) deaminase